MTQDLEAVASTIRAARIDLAADNAKPLHCEPQCWLCRKPLEAGQDVRPYQGVIRWKETKMAHSRCAWLDALRRAREAKAERESEDYDSCTSREIWFPTRFRSGV